MLTIEFARRQQGLTQAHLSGKARIASYFISLIPENGRALPSEDQARRLALTLKVPVETLLLPVPDLTADGAVIISRMTPL